MDAAFKRDASGSVRTLGRVTQADEANAHTEKKTQKPIVL